MTGPKIEPIPPYVLEFLSSYRVPEGHSLDEIFGSYDRLMNPEPLPSVGAVHEGVLMRESGGWRLNADILVPPGEGPHPVLVYFHGGGWLWGNSTMVRRLTRQFAGAGFLTVSVNYRVGRTRRFPGPLDDCNAAFDWCRHHIQGYGGDPDRMAVGGDSAGAHLAASVLVLRGRGPRDVAAAVLLYGVYDYYRGGVEILGRVTGQTPESQPYVPVEEFEAHRDDPLVNPVQEVATFPPCYLGVGSADPLLVESLELAARLSDAGIEHELDVVDGAPHSFFQLPQLPAASEGFDHARAFLARHLRPGRDSDAGTGPRVGRGARA